MRILYIIPNLQHPRVRGPHRHYHFIRELSKRHRITLLTLVRNKVEPEAYQELESYTERLFSFNVNGESNSTLAQQFGKVPVVGKHVEKSFKLRDGLRAMKKEFSRLVTENAFDVVCFHGKSMFPIIKDWSGLPIVTDFCDATSMRIRTSMRYNSRALVPLYYAQFIQMRQLEKKLIEKSDQVAFISMRDREAVLGRSDCSAILPLGVDADFWSRTGTAPQNNTIVFTGVMDYAPNHDAAVHLIEKILPQIQAEISDVKLLIVGRSPKPALLEKASLNSAVTVTGFVDDVRPYLEEAALFVAPVRFASGTQNKVLEAMAMAVPVVTTSIVLDGLRVDEGEPPVVAARDVNADFVGEVVRVLKDADLRRRLGHEGRKFVHEHFNWSNSAAKLEAILQKAVDETASGTRARSV